MQDWFLVKAFEKCPQVFILHLLKIRYFVPEIIAPLGNEGICISSGFKILHSAHTLKANFPTENDLLCRFYAISLLTFFKSPVTVSLCCVVSHTNRYDIWGRFFNNTPRYHSEKGFIDAGNRGPEKLCARIKAIFCPFIFQVRPPSLPSEPSLGTFWTRATCESMSDMPNRACLASAERFWRWLRGNW